MNGLLTIIPQHKLPMKTAEEWLAESAENRALEALHQARNTLVRALQEVDGYLAMFEAAETPKSKAEVLNWSLHHQATFTPNLRLDLIANAQAEFARLGK